jgi:hypothetical protein
MLAQFSCTSGVPVGPARPKAPGSKPPTEDVRDRLHSVPKPGGSGTIASAFSQRDRGARRHDVARLTHSHEGQHRHQLQRCTTCSAADSDGARVWRAGGVVVRIRCLSNLRSAHAGARAGVRIDCLSLFPCNFLGSTSGSMASECAKRLASTREPVHRSRASAMAHAPEFVAWPCRSRAHRFSARREGAGYDRPNSRFGSHVQSS